MRTDYSSDGSRWPLAKTDEGDEAEKKKWGVKVGAISYMTIIMNVNVDEPLGIQSSSGRVKERLKAQNKAQRSQWAFGDQSS